MKVRCFFLSKFVFEFRDGSSHAVSRNIGLAPGIVAFVMCRTFDHILETNISKISQINFFRNFTRQNYVDKNSRCKSRSENMFQSRIASLSFGADV